MTLEEFRQFSDEFSDDVFAVLNLETALAARQAPGAPSPVGVAAEIKRWQKSLGKPARKR
jgi:argininosuccinate lyase